MTATNDLDIAALDHIDYARPHREETRDLACKLSPGEYEAAGDGFAKAVRVREQLELEAKQEAARRKGLIETALGEERRLLKVLETHTEERPVKVKELWAKRNGEQVLVAVRLDLFTGHVDNLCYVGTRFPQPMDRQTTIKPPAATKPSASGPTEEQLQRQAAAALASADPLDGEPQAFEDDDQEDERAVIPMPGAAEPESAPPAKRERKERAAKTAAKAPKAAAKDKPKAKAKAK